jgi:hypothetical protein
VASSAELTAWSAATSVTLSVIVRLEAALSAESSAPMPAEAAMLAKVSLTV